MGNAALADDTQQDNWPEDPALRRALATLARIPEGREIVRMLRDNNILLTKNDGYTGSATTFVSIDRIEKGRISYSHLGIHFGALPEGNLIQALVHEAVHIQQHIEQRGYPRRVLDDAGYTAYCRALEAEAQAKATHIAWQLKQAGVTEDAFAAVKQVGYADVAQEYEAAATNGGNAIKAARQAWYNNPQRLAGYDADIKSHLIPYYRNLLSQHPGHGFSHASARPARIRKLDRPRPAI